MALCSLGPRLLSNLTSRKLTNGRITNLVFINHFELSVKIQNNRMRLLDRELFLIHDTKGVESTSTSVLTADNKERTAISYLSTRSCYGENKDQRWQAVIKMEGDTVPITAYVSLKVSRCGCWPFHSSHKLAEFTFDSEYSSMSHTSHTTFFDVQRLLRSTKKRSTSHIKICVLTQQEKLMARIGLNDFIDELLRSWSITRFSFKGREGSSVVTLILSQQLETIDEQFELRRDEEISDRTLASDNVEPLMQNSLEVEDVQAYSQGSVEKTPSYEGHQDHEAEIWVHRAIHVASRFRDRLAGPDEYFLEYLRHHYSVLVYLENARKKLHIKGLKKDAEECNLFVRGLLEKWKRDEAAAEQMNIADTSLLRLFH